MASWNRVRTAVQAEAAVRRLRRQMMTDATPPAGELFVTQFLVVSDQERSRDFCQPAFGADVVRDRDPVILALANTRIVLDAGHRAHRGQRDNSWLGGVNVEPDECTLSVPRIRIRAGPSPRSWCAIVVPSRGVTGSMSRPCSSAAR
jgi:hypothetical protein